MRSKHYIVIFFTFLFFFVLPLLFNEAEAIGCKVARPSSPPILYSAAPGDRSVTLSWVEAQDPVTYYLVRYGTSKENFAYGNPNIGGKGTHTFTVSELTNGVKYYFQVMAGNGCKPGEFSNTLTAVPGQIAQYVQTARGPKNLSLYKQVAGVSTSSAEEKRVDPTKYPAVVAAQRQNPCGFICSSWPLLLGEAIALLVFFYVSRKYPLKPTYSVLIPIFTYVIFLSTNKTCGPYDFFCKYFIPLNIMIFISIFILQKYTYMQSQKVR